MKRLFHKIDKFIPVKTYLIMFSFYFGMTVLFPVLLKLGKASEEVLVSVNTFNTYITNSIFLLMILTTNLIVWFKYEVSKKNHQNSKR
ncbi:hypothetical protein COL32_26955 [Bacillus pseudomycoides]|uniref:hypothetical protein n=1 Tax=Bacillus pseudomycoides TaxID=64104 RepID=UPI000BF20C25|nr:hypothetical protein [Bacillus pseudomycoides]PEK70477.1 hypothetical protein CN593_05525 [Bacillus pseudomycoides]PFW93871.1 hypothetical protein COL29_12060 [Bacillus pseudomycoides]PFX37582.1 hypothetical protein COL32_26955 [Bacillus pseudomycoides]